MKINQLGVNLWNEKIEYLKENFKVYYNKDKSRN